ncbi:MAG: FmdE family protein [Desulfopila sp.]|jgi:formylmethanofuran dehydrogenase subunit E|nr:FmdE family protein [Desulfopila sp.]
MDCRFSEELLQNVIAFHGHSCPGLAIGIRAAEYALQEFKNSRLEDLVCVTETDMCGVDGIQYLTRCTFGKGNLIHRDFGKAAFSFFDRSSGKAIRLLLRRDAKEDQNGTVPGREAMIEVLMGKSLRDLFEVFPLEKEPPRRARILSSLICDQCKEETMESRTRRFAGETLCIPCFKKVEQKV